MEYSFDKLYYQVLEKLQNEKNFDIKAIKEIFDRRKQQVIDGSIIELFLDCVIAESKLTGVEK